jgi:hypothetical protein
MTYLAKLHALMAEKQPDGEPTKPTEPSFVGFVSSPVEQVSALPPSITMGLHRLVGPVPRLVRDDTVWREIVADARRLAADGWAASALALGWSALDLFGHSDRRDGLAVWLRGRTLVLLDELTAVVIDGSGRAQFTRDRGGMPGARLLWELG